MKPKLNLKMKLLNRIREVWKDLLLESSSERWRLSRNDFLDLLLVVVVVVGGDFLHFLNIIPRTLILHLYQSISFDTNNLDMPYLEHRLLIWFSRTPYTRNVKFSGTPYTFHLFCYNFWYKSPRHAIFRT